MKLTLGLELIVQLGMDFYLLTILPPSPKYQDYKLTITLDFRLQTLCEMIPGGKWKHFAACCEMR